MARRTKLSEEPGELCVGGHAKAFSVPHMSQSTYMKMPERFTLICLVATDFGLQPNIVRNASRSVQTARAGNAKSRPGFGCWACRPRPQVQIQKDGRRREHFPDVVKAVADVVGWEIGGRMQVQAKERARMIYGTK